MSLPHLSRLSLTFFALSSLFPIVGALFVTLAPPQWMGTLDVIIAAALFTVTAIVVSRARRSVADRHRLVALRTTQAVLGVIPLLIAGYFVAGSRINWTVLILGLAWRAWLFVYSLPALIAALDPEGR